jgi:DNA methylase
VINPPAELPTLRDLGINKTLANKARKASALPKETFEAALTERRRQILANTRVQPLLGIAKRFQMQAKRQAIQDAATAAMPPLMTDRYRLLCTDMSTTDAIDPESVGLVYRWIFCALMTCGESAQIFDRHIIPKWKPVLWYTKGGCDHLPWCGDLIDADANDKRFHRWGQSVGQMEWLVRLATVPGQIILDPFCGGGTTGVAALQLQRMFIGVDIDQTAIAQTAARLKDFDRYFLGPNYSLSQQCNLSTGISRLPNSLASAGAIQGAST